MKCVDCGGFIPPGQTGLCIGGSPHVPLCRGCAELERGGPLPQPPAPINPLFPGVLVGRHSDATLLDLLNYWPSGIVSELCGPDGRNTQWVVRRYSGTLTLTRFEYRRDDYTKFLYGGSGIQTTYRQFAKALDSAEIRRESLRWFPSYRDSGEYDNVRVPARRTLHLAQGMQTPWGVTTQVIPIDGGVYWVKTETHGGYMLNIHRAAHALSQPALAIGESYEWWLCFEQNVACAVVVVEQPTWSSMFDMPDPVSYAWQMLQQHHPDYVQYASAQRQ